MEAKISTRLVTIWGKIVDLSVRWYCLAKCVVKPIIMVSHFSMLLFIVALTMKILAMLYLYRYSKKQDTKIVKACKKGTKT